MDLYVYDESISLLGIVDEFGSLMWISRSSSAGAFKTASIYLSSGCGRGNVCFDNKRGKD